MRFFSETDLEMDKFLQYIRKVKAGEVNPEVTLGYYLQKVTR